MASTIESKEIMPTISYHFIDVGGDFRKYDDDRSNFQRIFGGMLNDDPRLGGRVLDIGCGHDVNRSYQYYSAKIGQLDGVDPFPVKEPAVHLTHRWVCPIEDIPVPPQSYDLAYSYNVVEHIEHIDGFISKVVEMLKPGGTYWSMSPNYFHPFTRATRIIQRLGLLDFYRKHVNPNANRYPAYYYLSNDKLILNAISAHNLPVASVDFYYIPNVHWDMYLPAKLRFIAHWLDKFVILRKPKRSFTLIFRLQRIGEGG